MSNESIELLKPWTPEKMTFPGEVQPKLDGVPMRIRNIGGHLFGYTRQNERIESMEHIIDWVREHAMPSPGGSIIGEIVIDGMPFKEINGIVRTTKAKMTGRNVFGYANFHVFDGDIHNSGLGYKERMLAIRQAITGGDMNGVYAADIVRNMPWQRVENAEQAEAAKAAIMRIFPGIEGVVYHSHAKPFQPGTRRWDTQKYKPVGELDVLVTGFAQAVDKFGTPKPEIGTVHVQWFEQGQPVTGNVGPGRLTSKEKKALWQAVCDGTYQPAIATVHHLDDHSYDGLREGRFQYWRPDKSEADTYAKHGLATAG